MDSAYAIWKYIISIFPAVICVLAHILLQSVLCLGNKQKLIFPPQFDSMMYKVTAAFPVLGSLLPRCPIICIWAPSTRTFAA